MSRTHIVLLAGGKGRRFWPMSREARPKALLSLSDRETLLGATLARVEGLVPADRRWIIVPRELEAALSDYDAGVIVEPEARGTAAAIIYASLKINSADPGATLLFLPADHFIGDTAGFQNCLEDVVTSIDEHPERLVTLGVEAKQPSPMLGHIEVAGTTGENSELWFDAKRFVEKPSLEQAKELLDGGHLFLNSGIFAWRWGALQRCIRLHAEELVPRIELLEKAMAKGGEELLAAYRKIPSTSIDYLLLERVPDLRVRKLQVPWLDLGSWSSLHEHLKKDADSNVVIAGVGHPVESENCLVRSAGGRPVVLFGCRHLAVIDEEDVLLVMPLERSGEAGALIKKIKQEGLEDLL